MSAHLTAPLWAEAGQMASWSAPEDAEAQRGWEPGRVTKQSPEPSGL